MLLSRVRDDYSQPFVTKTPGKSVVAHRFGRQENNVQASATVAGKGKTQRVAPPLHDKTPYPNRIAPLATPGPQLAKSSLSIALQKNVRPSSTRKNMRTPQSASKSPAQAFKTPVTRGHYWEDAGDERLSFEHPVEQDATSEMTAQHEEIDDDEDIEYMPPTAIYPDYEPPFEMPSYKSLGKGLLAFAQTFPPYDDFGPPVYEYEQEIVDEWPRFDSKEMEDDDPFVFRVHTTAQDKLGAVPGSKADPGAKRKPMPLSKPTIGSTQSSKPTHTATTSPASTRPQTRLSTRSHGPAVNPSQNTRSKTSMSVRTDGKGRAAPGSLTVKKNVEDSRKSAAAIALGVSKGRTAASSSSAGTGSSSRKVANRVPQRTDTLEPDKDDEIGIRFEPRRIVEDDFMFDV